MDIPKAPCALTHSLDIQQRFGDYDAFQHVNNNAYMQYFDLGKTAYLSSLLEHSFSPNEISAVIVNINCNFYAPTPIGESLCVKTGCSHVGDKSFTLYQQIVGKDTDAIKSTAQTVLAGFNIATQTGAELDTRLREALLTAMQKSE